MRSTCIRPSFPSPVQTATNNWCPCVHHVCAMQSDRQPHLAAQIPRRSPPHCIRYVIAWLSWSKSVQHIVIYFQLFWSHFKMHANICKTQHHKLLLSVTAAYCLVCCFQNFCTTDELRRRSDYFLIFPDNYVLFPGQRFSPGCHLVDVLCV